MSFVDLGICVGGKKKKKKKKKVIDLTSAALPAFGAHETL